LATRYAGSLPLFMPSDRLLIETDKAYLRRLYSNDTNGLTELKNYATTLYNATPDDVELTSATFEGGGGTGQISNNLRLRRMAVEELIAERDPLYVAPTVIPRRLIGATVRIGEGGSSGDIFIQGGGN
jgi:hypothetical protein